MSLKSLIEKMDQISALNEATKETPTGRIHKAEPGGYGRKDDEDDEGKKVEPAVKRGRGRPKKGADSDTGEVKKYDFAKDLQSFMVGNLPGGKAPGKKGQVHKIKDESIEESSQAQQAAIAIAKKKKQGVAEGTKETSTGRVHKAEPGGYGRKDDEDSEGKKVQAQVKRGRGRPKKNADSDTGEVKKWDTDKLASWIVGNKPKTLPGKASVKHKLKDWMEHVEKTMVVESVLAEGRMKDMLWGEAERLSLEDFVDQHAHHPEDVEWVTDFWKTVHGEEELDEVALDPSQVAAPQMKAGTTPAAGQPNVQGTAQQGTQPGQQPVGGQPQLGAAIIDFKNPQDPLKSAIQQAVKNKQVTVMATESKQINEGMASKLEDLLKNYPHEHKIAQEGWGIHEALYQALCDHYWNEGKIPREKMYGPSQELRDWVEECYMTDTQPVMGEGLAGAALGGVAGAMVGKTPAAASIGANLGSQIQDTFATEGDREEADIQIKTPAFLRKGRGAAPLSLSQVGTKDRYGVGGKTYSIGDEPLARGTAAVSGQELSTLPESDLEASLRGNVQGMEEDYMSESKLNKQGVAEGSGPQKGDPVYYGSRLVGWFLGYSKYGKVITKPNYDEMGDEYANRDVYWDKDAVTIKSDKQGVAEGIDTPDIKGLQKLLAGSAHTYPTSILTRRLGFLSPFKLQKVSKLYSMALKTADEDKKDNIVQMIDSIISLEAEKRNDPWKKNVKEEQGVAEGTAQLDYPTGQDLEEGPHGGDDYTLGNPVDKEYVYQVWRTANDVRDYENMGKWVHDGGTTHSLADAKRRKDALIKGTHGVKAKIVRVPRSQFKLAGPQGHLPEEMGRRGVAEGSLVEMDKSAPQPGRDGRVSHSTYGSRDKGGSKGPEKEVKPITAKKAKQDALDILKKQGVAEGAQEDARFTPRPEFRQKIEDELYAKYLDSDKSAWAYTNVDYFKHDGKVYVEVVYRNTKDDKLGRQRKRRFLVNKDFTLTPILIGGRTVGEGVAEGEVEDGQLKKELDEVVRLYGKTSFGGDRQRHDKTNPNRTPDQQEKAVAHRKATANMVKQLRQTPAGRRDLSYDGGSAVHSDDDPLNIGRTTSVVRYDVSPKYARYNEGVTEKEVEESGLQAYLGNKKYGKEGMDALRKAGREGASKEKMAQIRDKHDKLDEVAPEGWEGTVKAMKKHKDIDNPWALAHWMKGKGMKSHKKEGAGDAQMEAWSKQLDTLLTEGLTITTSTGNEHTPDSVSVNATDADAHELMKLVQAAGLGQRQSQSMSAPAQDVEVSTVEPVSQDEVMGTLEPEDDGGEAMGFLKRMLGARQEHGDHGTEDHGGDYEEESGACSECGHEECECDHEEVSEISQGLAAKAYNKMAVGDDPWKNRTGLAGDQSDRMKARMDNRWGKDVTAAAIEKDKQGQKVSEMGNEAASSGDSQMSPVADTDIAALQKLAGTVPKREEPVAETDMEEGNLFTGNLAKARAAGKKEADLDGDGDMEKVREELKGGQKNLDVAEPKGKLTGADFAKLRGEKKDESAYESVEDEEKEEVEESALDQPATMESEKTCNECGMYESECGGTHGEEKLDEWANSPNDSDEQFLTDIAFMTKSISGGLNGMKQDQTVLPSTRVKTEGERVRGDLSLAELMRKLSNIN